MELCAFLASGEQGLLFEQDRRGREFARHLPGTRERLTRAAVRVPGSHAETGESEEGGDR